MFGKILGFATIAAILAFGCVRFAPSASAESTSQEQESFEVIVNGKVQHAFQDIEQFLERSVVLVRVEESCHTHIPSYYAGPSPAKPLCYKMEFQGDWMAPLYSEEEDRVIQFAWTIVPGATTLVFKKHYNFLDDTPRLEMIFSYSGRKHFALRTEKNNEFLLSVLLESARARGVFVAKDSMEVLPLLEAIRTKQAVRLEGRLTHLVSHYELSILLATLDPLVLEIEKIVPVPVAESLLEGETSSVEVGDGDTSPEN